MSHIATFEVRMAGDGTYVIQQVTELDDYRRVDRTVTNAQTIPEGLRGMAELIEGEARGAFGCPGYPRCRCRNSEWATDEDPHGAFGAPGMMGG